MRHSSPKRFGCHVDQLHLSGGADDLIGNRLALDDPRDALDHIVDGLEMLDVDGRDDVDAGGENLVYVLPAFGVLRARRIRVRQLVHERNLRTTAQHRVEVHLLEGRSPVLLSSAGDDLEVCDLLGGTWPSVGLHIRDYDVGAAIVAAPPFVEHGEGLADTRGGAQVHAQRSPSHVPSLPLSRVAQCHVQLEHVHAVLAEEPEQARCRCASR